MTTLSYKYKTYILLAAKIGVIIVFFGFIYRSMNEHTQAIADSLAAKRQEHKDLLAEQRSFELGQRDIEQLKTKPFQPDDLFSHDTKVVKEITELETISQDLGLKLTMQVSGTTKNAPKVAKAGSPLVTVPYTMILEGPFDKVVNFMERTENLAFISQTKNLNFKALSDNGVRATLYADFFIKQ